MKNYEIVAIINAYIAQKETKKEGVKLPAAAAWKRRINLAKLCQAKRLIDEALREMNEKYADDEHSTETDGVRQVKPEFMPEYAREQNEILTQETDVDIRKIRVEDLGDAELTDADMDTLAFMIEEGE